MELHTFYRVLASSLLMVCLMGLSACAWLFGDEGAFRDRSLDYKHVKQTDPIVETDNEAVAKRFNPLYPIPEISRASGYSATPDERVPKPKAIIQIVSGEDVRILREQGSDWLWLDFPPQRVWPSIKGFFKANKISLETEDDGQGLVETVWLNELKGKRNSFSATAFDFSAQSLPRKAKLTKLRVDIRADEEKDSTGILLSLTEAKYKQGTELPAVDPNAWVTSSKKKDVRARVVDELAEYILSDQSYKGPKALVEASDGPRVVLTEDGNGFPVLVLELDFNRAWEAIGLKLADANYQVDDIDRSIGIYFIKNTFSQDSDADKGPPPALYELKLDQAERGIQVTVQLNDEELAPKRLSQQVLTDLRDLLLL